MLPTPSFQARLRRHSHSLVLFCLLAVAACSPGVANTPTAQPTATQAAAPTPLPLPTGRVEGLGSFFCPQPNASRAALDQFGYGINTQWSVGDIGFWNSVIRDKLKLGWAGLKINWSEFEPERGKPSLAQWALLDQFVADANWRGLNLAMTITHPPQWSRAVTDKPGLRPSPPDDPGEAARFTGLIAARYRGCVHAIELFNEANLERDWRVPSGVIRASDYVSVLRVVAPVVRSANPEVLLIMAAPSPTGSTIPGGALDDVVWLNDFVAAGGTGLVDCVGVHLNGYNLPPDKEWDSGYNDPSATFRGPFDNPNHSWSFLSTLRTYRTVTRKPLCVTEFGWPSMDGLGVTGAPPSFGFALDNTAAEQAEWIVQAFRIMRESGYVRFAIVFNLDYIQKTNRSPAEDNALPYSLITKTGAPRPAFEAIERMPR